MYVGWERDGGVCMYIVLGTSVALPFAIFIQCTCRLGVSEQPLGGIPLGFVVVVVDKASKLLCV